MLHHLLNRQLKKLGIEDLSTPPDAQVWAQFLDRISRSYAAADQDRYLLERSLALSSEEMQTLYEDLRQSSEEKYRIILENIEDGYYEVDLAGDLTFFNGAFCDLLGYSEHELMGMNYRQYMSRKYSRKTYRVFNMVYRTGEPAQGVGWQIVRKDGSERYVEASISLISDAEGRRVGFRGIIRDVTERKRAEEELLKAKEAAEAATRAKSDFLAGMSHELRTPLTAVLALSEALQEQVYGPLNSMQRKSLHSIEHSGRHLLSLINDILDLSKIEAGKVALDIRRVSAEVVCLSSLQFIKQAAHDKRIRVSSKLDSSVTTLQADERRLTQILVNLLSNAVKFTPEGGSIGLEVVGDAERQVVHFVVWDTGIGISQDDRKRLFQPFVQLDSRLSRQHAGTGLGLALTGRMTQMHSGSISLESEVGKGSRFTVSLPWRGPAEPVLSGVEAEALTYGAFVAPGRRVVRSAEPSVC